MFFILMFNVKLLSYLKCAFHLQYIGFNVNMFTFLSSQTNVEIKQIRDKVLVDDCFLKKIIIKCE